MSFGNFRTNSESSHFGKLVPQRNRSSAIPSNSIPQGLMRPTPPPRWSVPYSPHSQAYLTQTQPHQPPQPHQPMDPEMWQQQRHQPPPQTYMQPYATQQPPSNRREDSEKFSVLPGYKNRRHEDYPDDDGDKFFPPFDQQPAKKQTNKSKNKHSDSSGSDSTSSRSGSKSVRFSFNPQPKQQHKPIKPMVMPDTKTTARPSKEKSVIIKEKKDKFQKEQPIPIPVTVPQIPRNGLLQFLGAGGAFGQFTHLGQTYTDNGQIWGRRSHLFSTGQPLDAKSPPTRHCPILLDPSTSTTIRVNLSYVIIPNKSSSGASKLPPHGVAKMSFHCSPINKDTSLQLIASPNTHVVSNNNSPSSLTIQQGLVSLEAEVFHNKSNVLHIPDHIKPLMYLDMQVALVPPQDEINCDLNTFRIFWTAIITIEISHIQ